MEEALARNTDPDTSHEAAASISTAAMERIVYEAIKKFPNGCIADDVQGFLASYRSNTITPRFAPLIRKGFIVDTGDRKRASSGRSQRVMAAVVAPGVFP